MTNEVGSGPLHGLRVVEMATYVSGPVATMMLADLGAQVIKVEPPTGDPMRRFGRTKAAMSPIFINSNRGKQSVCLDLRDPQGSAALATLLATVDVLVCNARYEALERLGIVDEDLVESNPSLIRVYVTGFGPDGPLAGAPAFDGILQGRTGLAWSQGTDERPRLAGWYVADKASAAMVSHAILAAVVARERTGRAERIDLSMYDALSYFDFPDIMANRTLVDQEAGPARNEQSAAARAIEASDGWLVVAPGDGHQLRRAFDAVGRPDLADAVLAFDTGVEVSIAFHDQLETVTRSRPVEHWLRAFEEYDVPAGPVLDLDRHLADEHVGHAGLYEISDWAPLGRVRHVRYPAVFSTWGALHPRSGPPVKGEHNDELAPDATGHPAESGDSQAEAE